MKSLFLAVCLLFPTVVDAVEDDADAKRDGLVAIHAFRRKTAPEMVYSIDPEEIARLKRTDGWEDRGLLGYGRDKPGPGLIKLQRAHRGRWHVFYTKAPEKLPAGTELEEFDVWVWEEDDEDLIEELPIGEDIDRGPFSKPNPMRRYLNFRVWWTEPRNLLYLTPGVQILYNLEDDS